MMFRRLVVMTVIVGGLAVPTMARAADDYLPGVADLPLMPGMVLEGGGAELSFDTPGGRIVDVVTQANTAWPTVRSFYTETLAQLGWVAVSLGNDGLRFSRDAERLLIEPLPGGSSSTLAVHFVLMPE